MGNDVAPEAALRVRKHGTLEDGRRGLLTARKSITAH